MFNKLKLFKLKLFKMQKIGNIEESELTIFNDMIEIKFKIKILLFLTGILTIFVIITTIVNIYLTNRLIEIFGKL